MKKHIIFLVAVLAFAQLCHSDEVATDKNVVSAKSDPIVEMENKEIVKFITNRDDILTCRMTIERLQREHYEAHDITPALSEQWFNNYFDYLDSQHLLFLQSDIDEFRPHSTVLWFTNKRIADTEFAFNVFSRYLTRLRERTRFELKYLDTQFDFSKEDSIIINRKKEPYPANAAEQRELWKKYVKNQLLAIKLAVEKDEKKAKGLLPKDDDEEEEAETKKPSKTYEERVEQLKKRLARQFISKMELDRADVLQCFLNALCELYDPHTCYMTPEAQDEMDMQLSLKLQGIGATLTVDDDYVKIVEIVEGSPAERTGKLKANDRIVAVAQEGEEPVDVIGMPLKKVVKQIRGPKGTAVTLTVLPPSGRNTYDVRIIRDVIEVPDEGAKSEKRELTLTDGRKANILILYLPSFYIDFKARYQGDPNYRSTTRDMRNLILKEKKDFDGIIIDMRGNGGGGLDEAINLSGLFFPQGNVVQKKNHDGTIEKLADVEPNTYFAGPLVIMVDGNSASAAEILAAALQDMGRALIVGDKSTHGKGTVQVTQYFRQPLSRVLFNNKNLPLKDLGGIKITVSKFYRINGGATQIKGVTPDIVFPSLLDNVKSRESDAMHPLAWDEIEKVPYQTYKWIPSIKEQLKANSEARMANSQEFQEYKDDIAFCKTIEDAKTLPLNIEARRKYEEEYQRYEKAYSNFFKRGKNYYKPRKDSKKPLPKDFILEETLNIMKDCIELQDK